MGPLQTAYDRKIAAGELRADAAQTAALAALRFFSDDVSVRLPKRELAAYLKRYEALV